MPLSQLDRRVHKKVHLHNDARARDLPECRWVHCAPTPAWRDMAPSPAAAFRRRPFPARYRLLCGPRPRNPQRVAGEYDNQQSARPQPKFVVNHSFNRAAETNGSHHSFNIRSMTPKFRPQLVPDVAGQQPRGCPHTGQHTTSAGAFEVNMAVCHVLKMSALVCLHLKNHELISLRAACGFSGITIRVHSF